ncbi:MAG: DUF5666 domain-containing protein [Sulfurifustis sp.]
MQGMLLRVLAAIGLVLGLAGCGDMGGTDVAGGGTGGTGISVGTISAVEPTSSSSGSTTSANIFVNGVKFTVDLSTSIEKDDAPATIDDLFDGLVVEVYGTISGTTGTADKVVTKDIVRGVIENNDGIDTIVVAGQTVVIDDLTVFNPPEENPASPQSISDPKLAKGSFIEAYGLLRGPGVISARYFESRSASPSTTTKVRGIVSNTTVSNTSGTTFNIGVLPVVVTRATVVSIPGGIRDGLFVDVEGTCSGTAPCGTLTADSVKLEALDRADGNPAQIEGYVTSTAASGPFTVGSQTVVLTSSTVFIGGMASDISVGVRLEVDGTLSNGVLTATKVIFNDNIRFEGDVASIDAHSLTLTAPNITVTTTSETEFVGTIDIGTHVRIRGRLLPDNTTIVATRVEERSASTRVVLQGPVQAIADSVLMILGIDVDTSTFTDQDFLNVQNNAIGRMAFFATLKAGDLVKADGDFNGSAITWKEVKLEN